MKNNIIISTLGILLIILLLFGVLLYYNIDFRDWVTFNWEYPDYLNWKKIGGKMENTYFEPMGLDRYRDEIVEGLSYEEILKKLPFLTNGDTYPTDSYKGSYLKERRRENQNIRILWFRKIDGFDWCIEIDNDKNEINLIKG